MCGSDATSHVKNGEDSGTFPPLESSTIAGDPSYCNWRLCWRSRFAEVVLVVEDEEGKNKEGSLFQAGSAGCGSSPGKRRTVVEVAENAEKRKKKKIRRKEGEAPLNLLDLQRERKKEEETVSLTFVAADDVSPPKGVCHAAVLLLLPEKQQHRCCRRCSAHVERKETSRS